MRLFKKQKAAGSPKQEELAGAIAAGIIRMQQRMATWLNGRTRHLSAQTRLRLLIVFCLLFAAVNLYLLIHSITH